MKQRFISLLDFTFFIALNSMSLLWGTARAQMTVDQLITTRLGIPFQESKAEIRRIFKNLAIYKGDYLNAYRINVPGSNEYSSQQTTFDYFGRCEYRFKYAKDKLVGIDVKFSFLPDRKFEFQRLLRDILNDFSKDKRFSIFGDGLSVHIDSVISFVDTRCKLTNYDENDMSMVKLLGGNFYGIES